MRISSKFFASFVFILIAAAGTACATKGHSRLDPEAVRRGDDSSQVTVRVDNQGFADVNVYVIPTTGGVRTRLGTVSGHTIAVLQVPRTMIFGITELRFLADPIGSAGTSVSNQISVTPGDEVTLMIPPQ